MNYNTYICYDLETTGPNPNYDYPIEFGAVVLNPKTLKTYKDNSGNDIVFESLVKIPDDFLAQAKADPAKMKSLEDALRINHKTFEDLEEAPDLKTVWENFINFVHSYSNKPSDAWRLPIPVTYNGNSFDNVMINRLAKEFKTVNGNGEPLVWHKNISIDMYIEMFKNTEDNAKVTRLNLDTMRDFLGLSKDGAHTALADAYTVKYMFCRFQNKQREIMRKINPAKWFERIPLTENEK